ncbi:MAG: hypothetical protein LBO08_01650 [Rickettsiales bacterium]|jgi:hypothetical protein|nr:hypothetical protein [Rickettsiales bacterium]
MIKKIAILFGFIAFFSGANAASDDFQTAAQLLSAARAGDVKYVETLVNAGANVNFVDNTGLSIVCTALMNNDIRAAQILQVYGADASNCDKQIKNFKNRIPSEESGGLFSGLSTAQGMTLAVGGAALVVGGLYLLTDVFGNGNHNSTNPSGNHPGGNGNSGGNSGGGEWSYGALPSGTRSDYDLNFYSPTDATSIYAKDFAFMSAVPVSSVNGAPYAAARQNYLLMMHGYSPLARGYQGMRTFRRADKSALNVSNVEFDVNNAAGGGRPVAVALITDNGINPTGSAEKGFLIAAHCSTGSEDVGCTAAATGKDDVFSKYYNDKIETRGDSLGDFTTSERAGFDLSGNGTVFNLSATDDESMLAKIIAGWFGGGRADGDYYGFMPNGQLVLYRTGGDMAGKDFNSWKAMYLAAQLNTSDTDLSDLTSIIVNASLPAAMRATNAKTITGFLSAYYGADAETRKSGFVALIDSIYDDVADTDDATTPGIYASNLFNSIGNSNFQMIVMPTGSFVYNAGDPILEATVENAAPLAYANLNKYFMSVVAVSMSGGTDSASVAGWSGPTKTNQITLSNWRDENGTTVQSAIDALGPTPTSQQVLDAIAAATADDTMNVSRACGVAGRGGNGIDPWCFAAAGATPAAAAAAAGGAVGAIKGAFNYMSMKQIFTLLAVTSEGGFLKTAFDGTIYTQDTLTEHLKQIYAMPLQYQQRIDNGEDYLSVFAEVYGYGLINLERATKPGSRVYYFDGEKISSANGNAYWRAASNTAFRNSAAFGARSASISSSFYDMVESLDGGIALPRVWNYDFSMGADSRHALYMGDVLSEFRVQGSEFRKHTDGLDVEMSFSEKQFNDNLGGLDNLKFGWNGENYSLTADYQRHFTDGRARFDGTANPILGLASNVISSGANFRAGNWSFGGRAFSGAITDESLLENDPTVSAQFNPAIIGRINGGESGLGYNFGKLSFNANVGFMNETNTLLGAYSDGLLAMGSGRTTYIDSSVSFAPADWLKIGARATIAATKTGGTGNLILGLTNVNSNAFSVSADVGNFSFAAALPLAATSGAMRYADARYGVVEHDDGSYELTQDFGVAEIGLAPDARETRLSGAYRAKLGAGTNAAFGFIYRINPNHTTAFGNESILMTKIKTAF